MKPKNNNTNWLDRPFPFMENNKEKLVSSFAFAVFVYLFLYVFQPFGISKVKMNIPIYLIGYFFVTLIVMLISNMLLPALFNKAFDPEKWDIKKSILFNSGIIIAIGFFNWLYNSSIEDSLTMPHSLGYFMLITVGVGVFPSTFFLLLSEKYMSYKNNKTAVTLEESIKKPIIEVKEELLHIESDNENESLHINASQLICMKSEGNYVQFYFEEAHQIKNNLLRLSLNKLETMLKKHTEFKRCHRSYIANFSKVEHVSGNARSYNLHFELLDFTVPVSRSFPKEMVLEVKKD
jgi:ribosomal protein L33